MRASVRLAQTPQPRYKETQDRAASTPRGTAYMERHGCGHGKKRPLQVGGRTVERIVRGRYEWRDVGGLRPMRGPRKRLYDEMEEEERRAHARSARARPQ